VSISSDSLGENLPGSGAGPARLKSNAGAEDGVFVGVGVLVGVIVGVILLVGVIVGVGVCDLVGVFVGV
jgi:hypothetical protein